MAKYLETLLRYRLRFIVLLLVAPLTIGTSTALLLRTYEAKAGLWIDSPSYLGQTVAPAEWSPRLEPAANATATLAQLLTTHDFSGAVADKLHHSGLLSDPNERDALVTSLGSGVRVRARGSHLVEVSYSTSRPESAVGVVRAVVALYLDHETTAQQAQLDVSTTFLTTRVTSGESASAGSQQALNVYLAAHPGLRAPAAGTSSGIAELDRLAQQLDQNEAELTQLRAELAQARFLGEAARRVVETNTKLVDEPRITGSGPLGDGNSLLAAAVLALVCWVGSGLYLLVLVWADQTARDPKDLERRLGVPVLTTIPLIGIQERF